MRKLKLDLDCLRVQSFDTGPGMALSDLTNTPSECADHCGLTGTVEAFADTEDCPSKKADTMCESPQSGQQGCFMGPTRCAGSCQSCHE